MGIWSVYGLLGLLGLNGNDLAASDAELLVHLAGVFLLTFDQPPHSAWVTASLEVYGEDKAVEEEDKADSEEDYEVGLADCEESSRGEGDPGIGGEVEICQPHVGHI